MQEKDRKYQKRGYINEHYRLFHLKDKEGQELDFHFHEFDKMVILLSGHVTYSLENEDYQLKPWSILLVPHHTIHRVVIDREQPYERIIIYFDRMYLRSILPGSDVMKSFRDAQQMGRYLLLPDEDQVRKVKAILEEYEQIVAEEKGEYGREAYLDTLMLQMLIWIGRMSSRAPGQQIPKIDEKMQDTLTYINEHFTEELSIDTLAARVHLSRSYFMHLFREETGTTVHAAIKQKRLLYAARLIREGRPINLAVSESGYSDYTAFFRSFKAAFGITPSHFRDGTFAP